VSFASTLPVALSAAFYVAVIAALLLRTRFSARRSRRTSPPVSVLKPIAGVDADLRENLASFARLAHPRFELLLGFASANDPGVPIARAFLAAHPGLDARIVWTREPSGAIKNPKVAQLVELERAARHEVIVISDANVRVAPDYLDALLAELERPNVGLTTSLVVGSGEGTLGAMLDAAQLVACVAPAVLAADSFGLRTVAIGKSMALRRGDLASVGGFASVGAVLAEDDTLAARFAEAKIGVTICLEPVESRASEASIATTFSRHARWAKMRRAISPACLVLELFALPSLVAAACFVAAPSAASLELALAALALQMAGAAAAALALLGTARAALRFACLEPARTVLHAACVARAGASRRVVWKGHAFRLGPGSVLLADAPRALETEAEIVGNQNSF
jgi:ceramide glucosyltransferase